MPVWHTVSYCPTSSPGNAGMTGDKHPVIKPEAHNNIALFSEQNLVTVVGNMNSNSRKVQKCDF